MRTLGIAAAVVLLGSAAQAGSFGFSWDQGSARVHIDPDCRDDSCGSVTWTDRGSGETKTFSIPNLKNLNLEGLSGSDLPGIGRKNRVERTDPTDVPGPQTGGRTVEQPAFRTLPPPPASTQPAPSLPAPPAYTQQQPAPPAYQQQPALAVPANAPAPEQRVAAVPPQPAAAPATGPVGLWITEKQEGTVRVEQCGSNICGYDNRSGDKVLVDLRPSGNGWKGKIRDTRKGGTGGTYDANVTMKGANAMRVEGCAFGGLFCGGQTWTRAN